MPIVIVAEKPSVARDLAKVLGAGRRGEGLLEGNGYRICWALGHLVHFAEPDDYGADWAARWSMGQLPMIPERWRLRTDKKTAAQFRIVRDLINAADTERVICATDAGREGELIFRLIFEHARCRKPVERLWVSSLTPEAIRAGFESLRPGSAFDPLAAAARARAQADWLVGMNLTRAYTVHNKVLCTIGRVQTPTLAMIVERDRRIAEFTKAYFYELVAHLAEGFDARYSRDGETRIDDKAQAERLHRQLSPHQTGTVTKVEKKVRNNRPPPLYDLTGLQRDANRRFGFTAAKVLELAQALYETHKLISYPRTESRHIGEDMVPLLPSILEKLDHPLAAEALERLRAGHRLTRAYVDRTKLTDHHAILPTGAQPPPGLPEPLRRVYDLVVARFVAVFLPDQRVEETRVELDIGGACFAALGRVVLDPGWKRIDPPRRPSSDAMVGADTGDDTTKVLPALDVGQTVHVTGMEVQERETQPPRPYDDATLLAAMRNAGREIDDDTLAAAMKGSGLGTPATRAEIIEKLIRTGYVERQRKQLRATDKGRALIAMVAEPLRSPELTARWEQRLADIEQGSADADAFYQAICAFVRELIPVVDQGPAMSAEQVAAARAAAGERRHGKGRRGRPMGANSKPTDLGDCPICKQGQVIETAKAYGCSRWADGCKLTIWKTVAGLRVPKAVVRQLLANGRAERIEGFKSRAGRPFGAWLRLDAQGKVQLAFEPDRHAETSPPEMPAQAPPPMTPASSATRQSAPISSPIKRGRAPDITEQPPICPKCHQGQIVEGRRGFGCSRWREGCDFVIWKQTHGRTLTQAQLRDLVERGRTRPIRGLDDGQGNLIDARLRLDDDWQVIIERDHPSPRS